MIWMFRLLMGVVGVVAAVWAGKLFVAGTSILYVAALLMCACGLLLFATGGGKRSKPQ